MDLERFVSGGWLTNSVVSSWCWLDVTATPCGRCDYSSGGAVTLGLGGGAAMRCSTLLAILTGVLLYLVLGAVVFRALETPREEGKHMQLQNARRDFLLNFTRLG